MRGHSIIGSVLLITSMTLTTGCADLLCGNDVIDDIPSPSGRNHAVVFQRDCGATTGFSVQVSVLPAGKKLPNEGGNAFTADAGHTDVPLRVRATWEGDGVLRLAYDPRLRTFLMERTVRGVTLEYPSGPSPR